MPMSSELMRDIVTAKRYGTFLRWARKLRPVLNRCDSYVPKPVPEKMKPGEEPIASDINPPRCKAWFRDLSKNPIGYGANNNEGAVVVSSRVWFRMVRLSRRRPLDPVVRDVLESALAFDGEVLPGRVSDVLNSLTLDLNKLKCASDSVDAFGRDVWSVGLDGGGRVYCPVLGLKRVIRQDCIRFPVTKTDYEGEVLELGDEGSSVVDVSCCHFTLAAHIFANGNERKRLVELINSGSFYESLTDNKLPRGDAKKQVLAGLFDFDCKMPGWFKFKKLFPQTARKIEKIRDRGRVIRCQKQPDGTVKYTRWGQRQMSRILTRLESKIFNHAICRLWRNEKIPALRIHDAILARASHKDTVERYLQESFRQVIGSKTKLDSKIFE